MAAETCPSCSAPMQPREVVAGWCESCGQSLPTSGRTASAVFGTLLTAPVRTRRTTSCWVVQVLVGLILAALGGALGALVFVPQSEAERFAFACFFGPPVGLPLAAALDGLLVGVRGRRLTFPAVLAVVAATTLLGCLLHGAAALMR